MATDDKLIQEIYLSERKSLIEGENKSADQFDQSVLTLSSGALGISVVFLEKIAPSPAPSTLPILCFSWFSLVVCLLSTLTSFHLSQHAYRRQRAILEKEIFEDAPRGSIPNNFTKWTARLNTVSIAAFVLGVTLLLTFSIQNIGIKQHQQEQATMNTNSVSGYSTKARVPQETPANQRPTGTTTSQTSVAATNAQPTTKPPQPPKQSGK